MCQAVTDETGWNHDMTARTFARAALESIAHIVDGGDRSHVNGP